MKKEKDRVLPTESQQIAAEIDVVASMRRANIHVSSRVAVAKAYPENVINDIMQAARAKPGELNAKHSAMMFAQSCVEAVAKGDADFFRKVGKLVADWQGKERVRKVAKLKIAHVLNQLIQLWDDWGVEFAERYRRITDVHGISCSSKAFEVEHRRQESKLRGYLKNPISQPGNKSPRK